MPITVEDYHLGQLFTLAEASRENTNGDTGVEIIANEPYENDTSKGQYTHKIFYMGSKLPRIVAAILPTSATMMVEKAWNAYPHCRTEYSNPFLGERFQIVVESVHLPDNGSSENALGLPKEKLAVREVVRMDISKRSEGVRMEPSAFQSEKTGRGPLDAGWEQTASPVMTCYKVLSIKFQVFGFQTKVEQMIVDNSISEVLKFHKAIFCAIDRWAGLTMEQVRAFEAEIKDELAKKMAVQEGLAAPSTPAESAKSTPF